MTTSLMAMLAHDLLSLTFFLTSHPIHFAYLLFFSPHLLSLLSFLSPLLLSTLLYLLALLTISPYHTNSPHLPLEFEFLGKTCTVALNLLCTFPGARQEDVAIGMLEELDKMVLSPIAQALASTSSDEVITRLEFEGFMSELCNSSTDMLVIKEGGSGEKASLGEEMEGPVQSSNSKFYSSSPSICELIAECNCEEKKGYNVINLDSYTQIKSDEAMLVGTEMSNEEFDDCKSCASDVEGKESESDGSDAKNAESETSMQASDGSVVGNGEEKPKLDGMRESLVCNATEERLTKSVSTTNWREHARTPSMSMSVSLGLQRDGSLRADKEWKRTLACKLYEERITTKLRDERAVPVSVPVPVKQGEGEEEEMDLIWEAIEVNSNKIDGHKTSTKNKGKKEVHRGDESGDDDGGEEEDDRLPVRGLCCLRAFRVSTRKMNLGVGRTNLVKFSKVLKKMSVFHHVGRNSNKISEEKEIGVIKR